MRRGKQTCGASALCPLRRGRTEMREKGPYATSSTRSVNSFNADRAVAAAASLPAAAWPCTESHALHWTSSAATVWTGAGGKEAREGEVSADDFRARSHQFLPSGKSRRAEEKMSAARTSEIKQTHLRRHPPRRGSSRLALRGSARRATPRRRRRASAAASRRSCSRRLLRRRAAGHWRTARRRPRRRRGS